MPDIKSRLVNKLCEYMNAPISGASIQKLTFPSHEENFFPKDYLHYMHSASSKCQSIPTHLQDKVSYGGKRDSTQAKLVAALNTLEGHIHRRLGHIAVNPHDVYNTSALKKSYRFSTVDNVDVSQIKEVDSQLINDNFVNEKLFVRRLLQSADEQYDLLANTTYDVQGQAVASHRGLVLYGDKGSGKTFLLNYLLSKYSRYFDRHKTIWVRINLANELSYDDNLIDWIHSQAAKIIIRYFNKTSFYFNKSDVLSVDIYSHFNQNVLPHENKRKASRLRSELDTAVRHFTRGGHPKTRLPDPPLSPSVITPEVAAEVVAAARMEAFRFIVVLDGLDMLEITKAYRSRFERLSQQAMELISTNKRNGFATLLVMRTTTVFNVVKTEFLDAFDSTDVEFFHIGSPDLKRVLDTRIQHIGNEVAQLVSDGHESWSIDELDTHLANFQTFLQNPDASDEEEDGGPSFLDSLEQIQGSNLRAKMHMVQYKYFEYLSRQAVTYRARYHAVEALMKAGRRFPPVPYRYSMTRDGCIRTIQHKQKYDSRFVPSLFRFPYVRSGRPKDIQPLKIAKDIWPTSLDYVLLGVRLGQFLEWQQQYYVDRFELEPSDVPSEMLVGDVVQLMEKSFGYNRVCCMAFLEEFFEFQLIDFRNSHIVPQSAVIEDNEIVCLSKLRLLLDKLCADIAYLNMAAMRLPLPEAAFRNELNPFVRAASLEEEYDGLDFWMAVKWMNSVAMVRLIRFINRQQEIGLHNKITESGFFTETEKDLVEYVISKGLFLFPSVIERSVTQQLDVTVKSVSDEIVKSATQQLESYIEAWP